MSGFQRTSIPFTEDDTSENYHKLIDSILPSFESDDGPVLRAAGDDLAALQKLYQSTAALTDRDRLRQITNYEHEEHLDGRWDSSLLRAITSQRLENVRFLLEQGAGPSGISMLSQETYARRFRRFLSDDCLPSATDIPILPEDVPNDAPLQLSSLTAKELAARQQTVSTFWGPPNLLPLDTSQNGESLHSLVVSAKTTPEIFDTLMAAGADARFWRGSLATQLPDPPTPSSLCLSTPLHSAISAGNLPMLQHIIEKHDFNPNARALVAGCQAWTPIQQAVIEEQMAVVQFLSTLPATDPNIVSPVYGVHILHLAAAKMDLDLLHRWNAADAFPVAPTTALGHTPFQIACLPLTDLHLQLLAPAIRTSIHDVRTLDPYWKRHHLFVEHFGRVNARPDFPTPAILEDPVRQARTAKQLIAMSGVAELGKQDIYGNTALHYLAAARFANESLIAWMRAQGEGAEFWLNVRNCWGYTPENLWKDRAAVVANGES
ncbi:MAG: hypothetical protein M1821_003313 [Bathelium mastoideum]|nr:MAG: hypothetical protein M1821_003313 [Bathelium mastoideum]